MNIQDLNQLVEVSKEESIPIIGPEKGEWLLNKVKELQPKKVLELGTAVGYSGCILGSEGAELITIDQNETEVKEAMGNFKKHNINALIIIGDCVEEVNKLVNKKDKFDLIFIDFAKKQYIEVLEDCISLCNSKGHIIADNITKEDCQDFLKEINKRFKTEIISIGDGLSISSV